MQIFNCPHCGKPIDGQAMQFSRRQRHLYPALVAAGMGHLWHGPGPNSFDPQLIEGARLHLKKWQLPCERGDALNTIRNKIRQEDWGWLELTHEAGAPKQAAPKPKPAPQARAADPGTAPSPGSPEYFKWLEQRRGPHPRAD